MNCPRIILLLDESGSMTSQRMEVIDGVNKMINTQRKLQEVDINIDIFKFNSSVKHHCSKKLSTINNFTSEDYYPNGCTALYDAISESIHKYRNEQDVIMIITTDGMENASKEHNQQTMISLIENQRKNLNWNFIYLSENPETVKQGYGLGFNNVSRGNNNIHIGRNMSGKQIGCESMQTYISDYCKKKTTSNYQDWQKI